MPELSETLPAAGRTMSLVMAMVAVAVGPIAYAIARRSPRGVDLLESALLFAVGGVVVLHVVPESLAAGGMLAGLALFLGPVIFGALERASSRLVEKTADRGRRAHAHGVQLDGAEREDPDGGSARIARFGLTAATAVGVTGLVLHGIMDGAALGDAPAEGRSLSWAIVLHRVIDGAFVWWLIAARSGRGRAVAVLGLLALSTLFGYELALSVDFHGPVVVAAFESFVAGTLLYLLVGHRARRPEAPTRPKWWALAGAVLGASFAIALPDGHAHGQHLERFLDTARALSLATVAGYAIAMGLVFWAHVRAARLDREAGISTGVLGAFWRAVAQRFDAKDEIDDDPVNAPVDAGGRSRSGSLDLFSTVVSVEFAVEAVVLAFVVMGKDLAFLWLLGSVTMIALAWFVSRRSRRSLGLEAAPASEPRDSSRSHSSSGGLWSSAASRAFAVVENTVGWVIAGVLSSALLVEIVRVDRFSWPSVIEVMVFAALASVLRVSALAAIPIAAALATAGASPGAVLAFALLAPTVRGRAFAAFSRMFGRWGAVGFVLIKVSIAVVFGVVAGGAVEARPLETMRMAPEGDLSSALGLCVLVLLLIVAILRRGPDGIVAGLLLGSRSSRGRSHQHHDVTPPVVLTSSR